MLRYSVPPVDDHAHADVDPADGTAVDGDVGDPGVVHWVMLVMVMRLRVTSES